MAIEHPLCFGQLSVWRAIEDWPANRASEVNLGTMIGVDVDPKSATRAISSLMEHTAGLRTSFKREGHRLTQLEDAFLAPELNLLEIGDLRELDTLPSRLHAEPFDLTPGSLPWRASLILHERRCIAVVATFHHLIADAWVLQQVEHGLRAILANDEPAPFTSPVALAEIQRTKPWQRLQELTCDHWQRLREGDGLPILREAPIADGGTVLHELRLQTPVPVSLLEEWSHENQLFLSSTLLSLALIIQSTLYEREQVGASLMSSNRIEPTIENSFTSMNQLTPISARIRPEERLIDFAQRVQDLSSEAHGLSCYSVDYVSETLGLDEHEHPVLMDLWFNFVSTPFGTDAKESPPPPRSTVEWSLASRAYGPRHVMFVRCETFLELTFRTSLSLLPKPLVTRTFSRMEAAVARILSEPDLLVAEIVSTFRE